MTYFFFYVILNAVKNPTEELTGIFSSLWSWDISLALNMTYFFYLSLRGKRSDEAISREGVGLRSICFIAFSASKQQAGFFGYVHYLPVIALYKEKLPVISAVRYKIHPLVFPNFFHVRFEFFLGEYVLAYINV